MPQGFQTGFFGIVVFCAEGVVLGVLVVRLRVLERMASSGGTLCFSRTPHFERSRGWARSLWLRRWTALRMDDILNTDWRRNMNMMEDPWQGCEYSNDMDVEIVTDCGGTSACINYHGLKPCMS